MTADSILEQFERTASQWISALSTYTPEQFASKPSPAEWSIGQVYQHLVAGTRNFHLRMVETCLGDGTEVNGAPRTDNANAVFTAGTFPPIRVAVPPSAFYTPAERNDPDAVRAEFEALVETMRQTAPRLADADPDKKAPHPGFGPLNAIEWYQLIEMHHRHHLDQRGRLESWLGIGSAVA